MYVRPENLESRTPYAGWSAKRDNKGLSQVLGTAAGRDILVLSYVGFVRSIGYGKKEVGRVAMPDNKAEKEKKESQYCTPYRLFFPCRGGGRRRIRSHLGRNMSSKNSLLDAPCRISQI